jgi:hypothetical protein
VIFIVELFPKIILEYFRSTSGTDIRHGTVTSLKMQLFLEDRKNMLPVG